MMDVEHITQIEVNKTDIGWIKSHMKTQTGLLVSIFLTILGAIFGLIQYI